MVTSINPFYCMSGMIIMLLIISIMTPFIMLNIDNTYANDLTKTILNSSSPFIGQGELFVGNAKSNSVSVVDLNNNHIVKNISVGKSPHDIKISNDQQTVYTTDTDSSTISIINSTSNTLIKQIPIEGVRALHGIAVYENHLNSTKYNNSTDEDSKESILYVGDVYGNRVIVANESSIIDEIRVGAGPEYLEISPNKEFLYVANLWSPISVVNLKDKALGLIKSIDSGKTPHGLSFNTDGSRLYIVNMHSNSLSIIDSNKHEVIKNITVGSRPEYVKLSPDERFAYVTNLGSNTISKVDLDTFQVSKEIPVGIGPHGIAFSADGNLMYTSNMNSSDVSVVDTSTDRVVFTIPVGKEPHQLVTKKPSVRILSENMSTPSINIEIADDAFEQSKGLMYRNNLEWNSGMLFVFDGEEKRSFWMKNTLIPLDMLFIDKDFKIVDIKENTEPCKIQNCPSYISKEPAKYVLEVNAGYVEKNGINTGDELKL